MVRHMTIVAQSGVLSTPARAEDDHERVVIRQDARHRAAPDRRDPLDRSRARRSGDEARRYPGGIHEALGDVLGLSRTMTLKARRRASTSAEARR